MVERGLLPQFALVAIGDLFIHIEAQHVLIRYGVGDGVFMQHVTKERFCGCILARILLKHRCTCKAKEKCFGEGVLNIGQHFAPHTAMTFIHDKHQAFLANCLYGFSTYLRIILDVRHLLDRGHDQFFILIIALQFIHQD